MGYNLAGLSREERDAIEGEKAAALERYRLRKALEARIEGEAIRIVDARATMGNGWRRWAQGQVAEIDQAEVRDGVRARINALGSLGGSA
ncbi:hypothetical protein [Pseudomonas sp. RIT-PI-AD]|uniref:hypothetical protein n=1 Tax=Pseudomonas sp. RIT-PI-AD TaxID=3035294 RepID=UPI0021DA286F|nr:hypothetical protein [Pseudomonas sp. RIT-PI-AD]